MFSSTVSFLCDPSPVMGLYMSILKRFIVQGECVCFSVKVVFMILVSGYSQRYSSTVLSLSVVYRVYRVYCIVCV